MGIISCTGHHRVYSGPALPRDSIAILSTARQPLPGLGVPNANSSLLIITELDKKKAPSHALSDNSIRLELLPGVHELKVRLNAQETSGGRTASVKGINQAILSFEARAGHEYEVRAEFGEEQAPVWGRARRGGWTAIICDTSDHGRVVALPRASAD